MMKQKWILRGLAALVLCGAMLTAPAAAVDITVQDTTTQDTTVQDTIQTAAADSSVQEALPLPETLSGNYIADLLAVAKSQVGYKSNRLKSAYSVWAGSGMSAWCSEFVSWCGAYAGIPQDIFPVQTTVTGFVEYYSRLGRYYKVNDSTRHWDCDNYAAKTISLQEIQPGDIIILDSNDKLYDGPEHSGIVQAVFADRITCIEGNYHGCVRNVDRTEELIHGVCCPDYGQEAPEAVPTVTSLLAKPVMKDICNTPAGIRVRWNAVSGAKSYNIYRGTSKNKLKQISIVDGASTTTYIDKITMVGTKYYYAVEPVKDYKVGKPSAVTPTIRLQQEHIKKVTNLSGKKLKVQWEKDSLASGYQLQYATNSSFTKGKKTINLSGKTKTSTTISGLSKKTYYVRVRSMKNSSGKYYSAWSSFWKIAVTK